MFIVELTLAGAPFEIGVQQAHQVTDRAPLVRQVIGMRLAELAGLEADRPAELLPAVTALQSLDPTLLEQLRGLAEGLKVDYGDLLRYTLSSYLRDRHRVTNGVGASSSEGCTTWAAAPPTARYGHVLLAKNRDYHRDHIPLQTLASVKPDDGYRYLCIGSMGSPTVFSSGINERGLAVADTHVLSTDLGPGLPRFSLMREVLEHHASTASALDYLHSVQHMGGGTLILADAAGHLAVCESGHRRSGFVAVQGGHLSSTNHFCTGELVGCWIEDLPSSLQGNSQARRQRVLQALLEASGAVDVAWAQGIMAAHGSIQDALCRHPMAAPDAPHHPSYDSSTISSVILLPRGEPNAIKQTPTLLLAVGQPCQAQWSAWTMQHLGETAQ